MNIFTRIIELLFGTKQQRDVKKFKPIVAKVNEFEPAISILNNDQLHAKTAEFRERLANGEKLDDIMYEAFAVVREVAKRTLGMRPFDVQIMGAAVLHSGIISEMKTGEGKTLVASLALYLNAIEGKGAHLVTVNDYLAKRDAEWMGPIYKFLGLTVGIINHDRLTFRVEWDDISKYTVRSVECSRQEAYKCDITYGTNNEFGFDYLRDNMVFSLPQKVQRKHNYAIVDEVDSILIDEARTPLIISGPAEEATDLYYKVDKIIPRLTQAELNEKDEVIEGTGDYALYEKEKNAVLTEQGAQKVEHLLGIKDLFSPKNSKIVHHVLQAVRAHKLFNLDVAYVVENGEVVIVDEFTGRKMPGRRWSDGLHQAIEAKERLTIKQEFQTLATITFQNYFRMYEKLAGMTGTAETEATEFYSIYKLDVAVIPTNQPVARDDQADKIFINERAKLNAIAKDVEEMHRRGQPVLLGTISVEKSEEISKLLKRRNVRHNVLNAKYHEREAEIIQHAGEPGAVTIATNMAGRGTDIKLGDGVREVGGLFVIGSERHEARRIDNQLRGRSGRQGDPGASQFYVSLTDDLMRLFGMDGRVETMQRMGFTEDDVIQNKFISNAIEKAQKRVEERNFEIRKNLLEYDNVMNEQRGYIYGLRDKILDISNNIGVIDELVYDVINDYTDEISRQTGKTFSWESAEVNSWLMAKFGVHMDADLSHMDHEKAVEQLYGIIKSVTWGKMGNIPDNVKVEAFKYVVLNTLDLRWKEHLRNIDALQEGIGLRGYAQKNPIVEYKLEAYDLFTEMRAAFKLEALSLLSRLSIKANVEQEIAPADEPAPAYGNVSTASHREYGQFDSMSSGQQMQQQQASRAQNASALGSRVNQPIHKQAKPGRNDPCWCGSGKKYKNCHMAEDEAKERAGRMSQ